MENPINSDLIDNLKQGAEWLIECAKASSLQVATQGAYRQTCERTLKTYQALKKSAHRSSGKAKLDDFLQESVNLPTPGATRQNESELLESTSNDGQVNISRVASDLAFELKDSNERNNELRTELKNVTIQLKKKESKRQCKETLRLCLKTVRKENRHHKKHIEVLNNTVQRKNSEMKRLRSALSYAENSKRKLKLMNDTLNQENCQLKNEIDALHIEVKGKEDDLNDSKHENDWLREIHERNESNVVEVFDHDRNVYIPAMQACVYHLLENHVSARQVSIVINVVLSLVGKKADRLPSTSTVHSMNLQRLAICQRQLAEVTEDSENTSLYTDETSKFGNKVCGYHIRDAEGNFFTLGMRELTTKSGKDTLEVLKEILSDIDSAAQDPTHQTSNEILANIRSTMSDSASTEVKFNELLEEYRTTILPYTIENYNLLDAAQKESVGKLLNFFCGLHSLVHFAETSSKALVKVENEIFNNSIPIKDPSFKKSSESGTTRLVRTACKAFARGADEKSGCHIQFCTYITDFLKASHQRTLKLVPYRGNRFNILFHNAGQVFLLHHEMIRFLETYELNRLTSSVLHDLKQPVFIAGCKALGLISKFVSTPLWNLLEDKSVKILEMNRHYLNLRNAIRQYCDSVIDFMAGKLPVFYGSAKQDSVYVCLTSEGPYDVHCEAILSVILPALCQYVIRKFQDYLPGGKFCEVTEEERHITESVEKHNKHCEAVFAYYDQLLRFKPHISTLASEAYVMFCLNKTGSWLDGKSSAETKQITEQARKDVPRIRAQFKERRKRIEQQRAAKLEQERVAREAQEAKRLKQQELTTQEIIYFGLWQSHDQVDAALQSLQTKTLKVDALKAQLRFRKDVLQQRTGDPCVFNFSKTVNGKRVQLSADALAENVKTLLTHAFSIECRQQDDIPLLVQKRVRHRFHIDGVDTWYIGKVISQVPGFPKFFNIVYEATDRESDQAVYSYKLMDDYTNGDLQIIVA